MQKLLFALKEGLINKNNLLLKQGTLLGITEKEIIFILKISNFEDEISYSKLLKILKISKKELEELLTPLLKKKLVKVNILENSKSLMHFDFSLLWEKLLGTLLDPEEDSSNEIKYTWFVSRLNIENTTSVKQEILKWINDAGFKRMKSIVENLQKEKISNLDFETIKKIYELESKEKQVEKSKLKELASHNWMIE